MAFQSWQGILLIVPSNQRSLPILVEDLDLNGERSREYALRSRQKPQVDFHIDPASAVLLLAAYLLISLTRPGGIWKHADSNPPQEYHPTSFRDMCHQATIG
jgi:hypothetical protein